MTFEDFKKTLEGSFSQHTDMIEVYWVGVCRGIKDRFTAPTEIKEENWALLLRFLQQGGGLDQLAVTTRVDSDE